MKTAVAPTDTPEATDQAVRQAVQSLNAGEVVGLPTETVYGLAGDALNETAVARIFEVKERPAFDPLIVHLPDEASLNQVAVVPDSLAKIVRVLTTNFWPGPLTLLLPKSGNIPSLVTAGLDTVAVRMSSHPIFRRIIKSFGRPLAAPSANRFGRISPTSAAAVMEELGGKVPLIIDGGACSCGLESTIIRIHPPQSAGSKPGFEILRAGPVTADELKKFGVVAKPGKRGSVGGDGAPPEVPGQLPGHYAPGKRLRALNAPADFTPQEGKRYGLLSYRAMEKDGYLNLTDWAEVAVLSPGSGKLPEAAIRFFHLLRQLDASDVDEIIAEPVPERGLGVAIMERLRRASATRPAE